MQIDTSIYDRVRAFRAPNSKHPRSGLHKRRLTHQELIGLSVEGICKLAKKPAPFDLPNPKGSSAAAAQDWQAAVAAAGEQESIGVRYCASSVAGTAQLNRLTLDFLRDGAEEGERAVRLFSAAANLAEFGCPPALAHALLTDAALDSGLPPSEVRRQIDCGLRHVFARTEDNPNG